MKAIISRKEKIIKELNFMLYNELIVSLFQIWNIYWDEFKELWKIFKKSNNFKELELFLITFVPDSHSIQKSEKNRNTLIKLETAIKLKKTKELDFEELYLEIWNDLNNLIKITFKK